LLLLSLVHRYYQKTKKKAMTVVVAFFGVLQPKRKKGDDNVVVAFFGLL
jgi:hypothetical protein